MVRRLMPAVLLLMEGTSEQLSCALVISYCFVVSWGDVFVFVCLCVRVYVLGLFPVV